MTEKHFDIVIIGAGPVGLSFARALAETNCKIALIEQRAEDQIKNPAYDGREIALTHLSQKLMQNLNIWDKIPQCQISTIQNAKVLNGKSPYSLNFYGLETSKEHLGFMTSNHLIRKAAYDAVSPYLKKNVTLLADTEVKALKTSHNEASVELSDGTLLKTSMIVSADSRFSRTRQLMGISTDMLDFGRTCIVCKMSISGDHDNTALECFHYDRTLAILPLNNQEVSVVITLDSQDSDALLSMDKEDFAQDIIQRCKKQFGNMELITDRISYPLTATYAKTFYKKRYAVIGDAAVGMHPVTAHGFNLGLQSVHTLSQELIRNITEGADIAAKRALQAYNFKHRRASKPMYLGTNALVRLYTNNSRPAHFLRHALLRIGNRFKPAKHMIMKRLTETQN